MEGKEQLAAWRSRTTWTGSGPPLHLLARAALFRLVGVCDHVFCDANQKPKISSLFSDVTILAVLKFCFLFVTRST